MFMSSGTQGHTGTRREVGTIVGGSERVMRFEAVSQPNLEPGAGKSNVGLSFCTEVVLVLVALAVLIAGAALWTAREPQVERTDFSVTYLATQILHRGENTDLYDLSEQRRVKATLYRYAEPLIFEHPPFEALLMAPIGRLPYQRAYLAWALMNGMVWLTLPFLLRPYCPRPVDQTAYLAAWIFFAPLGDAFFQGQPSIVLLLIYVLSFVALKRGSEFLSGMLLALGLFKFQFVVPFALIFLFRKRWKFLKGFSLAAVALGLLSLIAVGWRGLAGYTRLLLAIGAHPTDLSYGTTAGMATLMGFAQALLSHAL